MAKIFPVIVKRVTQAGGGDLPPGAAVMTDSLSLVATVFLDDTNAVLSDTPYFELDLALADTNAAQAETLTVAVSGDALSEMVSGQADALLLALKDGELADTLGAQGEDILLSLSGEQLNDAIATQAEAALLGFSGAALSDANAEASDSKATTVFAWGNTTSTAGTAPTNPGNATGANNGTLAQVKAGGIANGTSTLNVTLASGSVPAGSRVLRAWYQTNPAAVGDTLTLTFQGGGTTGNLSLPAGDFLATPYEVALPGALQSQPVFVFTIASTTPATGGNIQVDAVAVVTSGVF